MTGLGIGSALAGGLVGWCVANVECLGAMLALPPTPLTEYLVAIVRWHGTEALQSRHERTMAARPRLDAQGNGEQLDNV